MDDLISRQAAIDAADRTDYLGLAVEDVKKVTDEVVKELKKLPSAQQEIIRCKDCKYGTPNGVYGCRMERFSAHDESIRLFSYDYCSAAEVRDDAT